jgi:hypothetical protein
VAPSWRADVSERAARFGSRHTEPVLQSGGMSDDQVDRALRMAADFDALIDRALDERQEAYRFPVFDMHPLRRHRVHEFGEAFRDGQAFPLERLPGAIDRAIDVKLQSYLTELVGGLINDHYFTRVNADPAQAQRASVQLMLMSLHQDEITKSRILWERIMGWVHHIETGADDIRPSNKRSAKKIFFEMCRDTPRWRWLAAYEPAVTDYDDRFRTPEVHKRSTLRASLMHGEDPTKIANDLLALENMAMNQVWDNVQLIVGRGGVVSLGGVHIDQDEATANVFDEWGWQPAEK